MERISISNFYKNGEFRFEGNSAILNVVLNGEQLNENNFNLVFDSNVFVNLLILNLKDNTKIQITQNDYSSLRIECLFSKDHKETEITANLGQNAEIVGFFADFSTSKFVNKVDIHLNKEGASARWKVASLSSKDDNKTFDISLYHHKGNTNGVIDNYGVCKDDGKLVFSGTSHIEKNSKNSKTKQNAKIMVFDRYSNAIAKPILKIDENEIEASHAATVGKVSDDELFYLTSRGLSESTAKELITLGYLKPIVLEFKDEEIQAQIMSFIEGRM